MADQESIFWLGSAAYVLAPPVIHCVHKNCGTGAIDFGLRLVVPAATSLAFEAGSQSCAHGGSRSECNEVRVLSFLGAMGAMALIDMVGFAYETLPMGATASRWAPTLVHADRATLLGVTGIF